MTVLLVDDQISILSGLVSGLNWTELGVSTIRTATNAVEARRILQSETVDILLCDIEMPGENGLSLLRWSRQNGYDFVCVFLTSHADFLYAKEAIQLNCFDYILQPARYDTIQATIARAIKRVQDKNTENFLKQNGTSPSSAAASLFQNLFSDWSVGKKIPIHNLCDVLRQLGQEVQRSDDCFVIWGHLLSWKGEPWPTWEWRYALNNIITEVYEAQKCQILPFVIDYTSMGWFIHMTKGHLQDRATALQPLHLAYQTISGYLPCNFAFYISSIVPLEEINAQSDSLLHAKQNNVLHKCGIFCPAEQQPVSTAVPYPSAEQFERWEALLVNGGWQIVETEILDALDKLTDSENLGLSDLRTFGIQFQQIILHALWKTNHSTDEFLKKLNNGKNAHSLQELRDVIRSVTAGFSRETNTTDSKQLVTKKAKNFVEDHLSEALTVNDVASSLFLNADYLSRIFKSETGISLKEYIIRQKMEAAQILLKTTTLPVSIIASKCGYDNFSYFSQVYRKVMGISPTDERK